MKARPMSALGLPRNVRFTSKSGHQLKASECPLSAKGGLVQCSEELSLFEARSCVDERRLEQIAEMSSFPPIAIIGPFTVADK
jgi:hypothetical protein